MFVTFKDPMSAWKYAVASARVHLVCQVVGKSETQIHFGPEDYIIVHEDFESVVKRLAEDRRQDNVP
jgi:hypothetical protein